MWRLDLNTHTEFMNLSIHLILIICNKQKFESSRCFARHNKYSIHHNKHQQVQWEYRDEMKHEQLHNSVKCQRFLGWRIFQIYSDQRLNFVRSTKLTLLERYKQCSGRCNIYFRYVVWCVMLYWVHFISVKRCLTQQRPPSL